MRPTLLDLFCKEGGAGKGYDDAGFYVLGVDIEPQSRYPFKFVHDDALAYLDAYGHEFDVVHASPPCQFTSKTQRIQGNDHPNLIVPVRRLLRKLGKPYIIENVPGAPLINPVELCGSMFGLDLYRHRWFECSFPVTAPLHGGHFIKQTKMGRAPRDGEFIQPVGNFSGIEKARAAMGMPWASQHGLAEAIPPAYTEFIGSQLLEVLERAPSEGFRWAA